MNSETNIETPQTIQFFFINRNTKKYLIAEIKTSDGKVEYVISNSDNGIQPTSPVTNNPVVDALPRPTGNILKDCLVLKKPYSFCL